MFINCSYGLITSIILLIQRGSRSDDNGDDEQQHMEINKRPRNLLCVPIICLPFALHLQVCVFSIFLSLTWLPLVFSFSDCFVFQCELGLRRRIERVGACKTNMSERKTKKANLRAAKRERILLPICDDGYRISEFLSHPFGIQAMLNTKTLQSFESLDANTYRCYLPKLQLLNFEAAPVMDLRVTPTEEDCTVEMLSCKVSLFCPLLLI